MTEEKNTGESEEVTEPDEIIQVTEATPLPPETTPIPPTPEKKPPEKDKLSTMKEPLPILSPLQSPLKPTEEDKPAWGACADTPPTSTVELNISCRDLKNLDLLSKSDPMVVCFYRPSVLDDWEEIQRTETIENDLNPNFMTKVTVLYRFEERQLMKFAVYDVDQDKEDYDNDLSKHEMIGYIECTLANIVSSGAAGFTKTLLPGKLSGKRRKSRAKECGSIILIAEELATLKDEMSFKLEGHSMGSASFPTCFCVKPKIFYMLSRHNEAKKFLVVYRSPLSMGTNPKWETITLPLRRLCNGDKDLYLKLECYQYSLKGSHISLGYCYLSVNKMVALGTGGINLTLPSGKASSATLTMIGCTITKLYTFIDYISSGTQINCCISIDFTSSNGDPRDRHSLHHFSSELNHTNPYVQAIESVVSIISDYDADKIFPVYGFGAKIPPNREISHNFFITLGEDGYCEGIEGIVEHYKSCISKIELYGPTNFSPVIKTVSEMAKKSLEGDHYYILLIITDGIITDIAQTKEAIVDAADLPISIIIIGVGGEDFDEMDELDGDRERLTSRDRVASRDIVQFIPYRDAAAWLKASVTGKRNQPLNKTQKLIDTLMENPSSLSDEKTNKLAQEKLAECILNEIPDQITGYMKSKGITPGLLQKKFITEKEE